MEIEEVRAWVESPVGEKLLANLAHELERIQEDRASGAFDLPGDPVGDYIRGGWSGKQEAMERICGVEQLVSYIMWEPDDE